MAIYLDGMDQKKTDLPQVPGIDEAKQMKCR
jgi:hypothetical protein